MPRFCKYPSESIDATENQILKLLNLLQGLLNQMALDITALKTAAQQETTVEKSAIALLNQLSTQIQTLITNSANTINPADLQTIVDQLNSNATSLASAVTVNTPAAPPPPPPPIVP